MNEIRKQTLTRNTQGRTFVPSEKEFKKTRNVYRNQRPAFTPAPPRPQPAPTPAPTAAAIAAASEWKELKEQATYAFESGLLPRAVDTAQKAVTIALMGREVGLSPLQALCGIYVVNGMAMLRGGLMLRLIYERVPGAELNVLTPPEKADTECEVEMKRPGGKAHVFRFDIDDAKKAGFLQKPIWQLHTSTMLRWAAIRTGARIVFADALAGCYMEDEIPVEALDEAKVPAAPIPAVATKAPQAPAMAPVLNPVSAPVPERFKVSELPMASQARPVTEKQVSRLYGIAHGSHWTRPQVNECLQRWFHKSDPHSLTRLEYDKICNFILETPDPADSVQTLLERRPTV